MTALNACIRNQLIHLGFIMMADIRPLLAERIRWYRERAKLSQRGLAEALKIDKATIFRAESGEHWPEFGTIVAIAGQVSAEPEELFAWAKPTPEQALQVIADALAMQAPRAARLSVAKTGLIAVISALDDAKLMELLPSLQNILLQAEPCADAEDAARDQDEAPRKKR